VGAADTGGAGRVYPAAALSALNQGAPMPAAYPKSPVARVLERMAADLDTREPVQTGRTGFSLGSFFGRRKSAATPAQTGAAS
jgi:Flp pilus assembly CpaE family ATPase